MERTYADLQKRIEKLKAEADRALQRERAGVVERIKEAIATYDLSAADLGLAGGRAVKKAASAKAAPRRVSSAKGRKLGKVPVKYRDRHGNSWSGRGLHPVWLREAIKAGARLDSFLV